MKLLEALLQGVDYQQDFKLDFKGEYVACHNCNTKPVLKNTLQYKLFKIIHRNHLKLPISRKVITINGE